MSNTIKNVFFLIIIYLMFLDVSAMNMEYFRHSLENLRQKASLTERTYISNADVILTDDQVRKILTGWHRRPPLCVCEPIKVSTIYTDALQENDCEEILNKFFVNHEDFKKNININLVWYIIIKGKLTEEDPDDFIRDRIPDIIALLDGKSIKEKKLSATFADKSLEEQTAELRNILDFTNPTANLLPD